MVTREERILDVPSCVGILLPPFSVEYFRRLPERDGVKTFAEYVWVRQYSVVDHIFNVRIVTHVRWVFYISRPGVGQAVLFPIALCRILTVICLFAIVVDGMFPDLPMEKAIMSIASRLAIAYDDGTHTNS
jgi:hypothetical protein